MYFCVYVYVHVYIMCSYACTLILDNPPIGGRPNDKSATIYGKETTGDELVYLFITRCSTSKLNLVVVPRGIDFSMVRRQTYHTHFSHIYNNTLFPSLTHTLITPQALTPSNLLR